MTDLLDINAFRRLSRQMDGIPSENARLVEELESGEQTDLTEIVGAALAGYGLYKGAKALGKAWASGSSDRRRLSTHKKMLKQKEAFQRRAEKRALKRKAKEDKKQAKLQDKASKKSSDSGSEKSSEPTARETALKYLKSRGVSDALEKKKSSAVDRLKSRVQAKVREKSPLSRAKRSRIIQKQATGKGNIPVPQSRQTKPGMRKSVRPDLTSLRAAAKDTIVDMAKSAGKEALKSKLSKATSQRPVRKPQAAPAKNRLRPIPSSKKPLAAPSRKKSVGRRPRLTEEKGPKKSDTKPVIKRGLSAPARKSKPTRVPSFGSFDTKISKTEIQKKSGSRVHTPVKFKDKSGADSKPKKVGKDTKVDSPIKFKPKPRGPGKQTHDLGSLDPKVRGLRDRLDKLREKPTRKIDKPKIKGKGTGMRGMSKGWKPAIPGLSNRTAGDQRIRSKKQASAPKKSLPKSKTTRKMPKGWKFKV